MKKHFVRGNMTLHLMLLIPMILLIIYSYGPLVGLLMAFQDFIPSNRGFFYSLFLGDNWVGLDVFRFIFRMPNFTNIVGNTLIISTMKLIARLIVPLVFALLLNEVTHLRFKRFAQSITFVPYFLSWVVVGGILLNIFSPTTGIVPAVLARFGIENFFLFGTPSLFPTAMMITDLWKEIGFNTIIYLAALTGVDPGLYEAASIDGAGRFKQCLHISIPSLLGVLTLLLVLGVGNIMSAGFEQIYMLYSPAVYSTGDIIDTFAFRMGIRGGQFSMATAVELFKSVVSFTLMLLTYFIAKKFTNYRIF
jgi:putative aldouronate transport system permease protein